MPNDQNKDPSENNKANASSPPFLNTFKDDQNEKNYAKSNLIQIPTINTPRGGGALKSIDEKFQVNASNGTASLSLPVPFSNPRSDFAPRLSLQYNSGSGNSAFGLGWNIDLPSIKRRTDKLLPQYRDSDESDTFQFTGMEDLVPFLIRDSKGNWNEVVTTYPNYSVKQYRPRTESGFSLIEKVTSSAATYWKITTKANVVTYFGLSAAARIADPTDGTRIFKWFPEFSYDDKGNCLQYYYVPEDNANIPPLVHERNRLNGNQLFTNTYLKGIKYGNTMPFDPNAGAAPDLYNPIVPGSAGYMFQLVLDYGDHDLAVPLPKATNSWSARSDAFSDLKSGFEMRTYRLCRRFLLFHSFKELDLDPVLVRSLDMAYQYFDFKIPADPYKISFVEADFIASVTETGWYGTAGTGYTTKSYPPLTFTYRLPVWDATIRRAEAGNLPNVPEGLTDKYQFTDLWNEGISGILTEQQDGWYYNHNLGGAVFEPAVLISPKPSFTGLSGGGLLLQNMTGDGRKFIVSTMPPNLGFFELRDNGEWQPFKAFANYPIINLNDPNVKLIDVNGDGMPDIVVSEEMVFRWYPAQGEAGYDSAELAPKPFDEEKGPALVFADPVQCIFLADMTGDGLTDVVRIRYGEIAYWPNKGYGLFGAKVSMFNAPLFDTLDHFNPAYLHLADINGTGATDIIYAGKDKLSAWLNLSGNAWGAPFEISAFPHTASPNQLAVADLLGNGTACIVWSSPLPTNADAPIHYIDLMSGRKPYLLKQYSNGMGKTVTLNYKSSTWFYLQDKLAGTPWVTKLPFPVHCVEQTTVDELISGNTFSTAYTYHHGYYDHPEKEFRGFGRVEQTDTDIFSTNATADQTPVLTKTWYHTGAYFGINRVLNLLAHEYFQNPAFSEHQLPEPAFPDNLSADEAREALRACKGMVLREEFYALDASVNPALAPIPFTATSHNNNITKLQPQANNLYASFLVTESEVITYNYERNPSDPRISHTLNTAFDPYGNIIDSFAVVYPRQNINPAKPGGRSLPGNQPLPNAVVIEQQKMYIIYTNNAYTSAIITTPKTYRLPVACETIVRQLTNFNPAAAYFSIADFANTAAATITKLKHQRTLYFADDLVTILPLQATGNLGLLFQTYHLAFDASVTALSGNTTDAIFNEGHYIKSDAYKVKGYFPASDLNGEWWIQSGYIQYLFKGLPQPFYQPYEYIDAAANPTTLAFNGGYWLLLNSITDVTGNMTSVSQWNYRTLLPQVMLDENDNESDFRYDMLGHLVAVALKGKGEGDSFAAGFTADLTQAQVDSFFIDPVTNGPGLMQGATTRFIYRFPTPVTNTTPFSAGSITRRLHAGQPIDPRVDTTTALYSISCEYTDGLGRTAMKKIQADLYTGKLDASVNCDGGNPAQHRWIGKGKTVYNNKGKPVMQYEPYFSPNAGYEAAPANGVTPIQYYDPLGRKVKKVFPDQSFETTEFDSWVEIVSDQNDNVLNSGWYLQHLASGDSRQVDAANKASAHDGTPTANHLDCLGRNFYSVVFNKLSGVSSFYATQAVLDALGNPLQIIDALGNSVMEYDYDLVSRTIHQASMDSGSRWILHNVMNLPLYQWDVNLPYSYRYHFSYDLLNRPLTSKLKINTAPEAIIGYNVYGEGIVINGTGDKNNNLRNKLFRQFDDAGLVTNYLYDFKSNLVQSSRRLTTTYKSSDNLSPVVIWSGNPAADVNLLQTDTGSKPIEYISLTVYDALNRPNLQARPFATANPGKIIAAPYSQAAVENADVLILGYGESGALNMLDLYFKGVAAGPNSYISRICHNEKGQRLCVQYGNNSVTKYSYDANTFRLVRLLTTRNSGAQTLQDLNYYYDPAGNITYLLDNAQPPIFYAGQKVLSDGNYTYDAVYRLVSASGREQVAQNTVNEGSSNTNLSNYPFNAINPLPAPTDALAMRNYTQNYSYDAVGNMTTLQHVAGAGSYTRSFAYNNNAADRAAQGVNPLSTMNNQLLATNINPLAAVKYSYDGHGNMFTLPELPKLFWNFKDHFSAAVQQATGPTLTGRTAYYNYDAANMRIRKVIEGEAPSTSKPKIATERLYLGNFEIYRSFDSSGNVILQRETLHLMDEKNRIATIDKKTIDTAGGDSTMLNTYYSRYQVSNHLDTCAFELDDTAKTVTWEEYHPFGTTSFQAADASLDIPAKRYRYTGKERDEESGLYYHGARYYAPWLCRWVSCDPIGIADGINRYEYGRDNPVRYHDKDGKQNIVFTDEDIKAHPESHVITGNAPSGGTPPPPTASNVAGTPANVGNLPANKYVDVFQSVQYDLNYKATGGNLSNILHVTYKDGTVVDIDVHDIKDEKPDPATTISQMEHAHVGEGGRIFPEQMNPGTTPGLAAAKKSAIETMEEFNYKFMLTALPAVLVIIFAAGMPMSVKSGGRSTPRLPRIGGGAGGSGVGITAAEKLGEAIGKGVSGQLTGKMASIVKQVSQLGLSQSEAAAATNAAVKAIGLRTAVTTSGQFQIVASVMPGVAKPVLAVAANGSVFQATADIVIEGMQLVIKNVQLLSPH